MTHPRKLLDKYDLVPDKKLGQNFLTDDNIVRKIVDALDPGKDDAVLEIGCGTGMLTRALAGRAGGVSAAELDFDLFNLCENEMQDLENVEFLLGSVLDSKPDVMKQRAGRDILVCGNLPYYLSTEIAFFLLSHVASIRSMVLMFQTEVAQRMYARPGGKDYGILSVRMQYRFLIRHALEVPPSCFYPVPQVGSSVIRLDRIDSPEVVVKDEKLLALLVKTAFGQRRKTLRNSLKSLAPLDVEPQEILTQTGIEPTRRPETVSVNEWVNLANAWPKSEA